MTNPHARHGASRPRATAGRLRALAIALAALLALHAAPAAAQMGGMGGRGGRGGPPPGGRAGRAEPMINTVDLLLMRGHDLALTDSQVVRLTAVKARQDSALALVRERRDSAGGGREAWGGDAAASEGGGRRGTGGPIAALRAALSAALKTGRDEAFAQLTKRQRKQAEKLEKQARKEAERNRVDDRGPPPGASR